MTPHPELLPEQESALRYVRRRGTEATLGAIRSRLEATYSEIEALVEGLPAGIASQRPSPGRWSVLEVVDHLVQSERPAVQQLAGLLAGKSSESPIPAGLQSAHPLDIGWSTLLGQFRTVHRDLLGLLDSATDATPLGATAPVEMVVKCASQDGEVETLHWLERFDWKAFAIVLHLHNREHIGQVQRILAAEAG